MGQTTSQQTTPIQTQTTTRSTVPIMPLPTPVTPVSVQISPMHIPIAPAHMIRIQPPAFDIDLDMNKLSNCIKTMPVGSSMGEANCIANAVTVRGSTKPHPTVLPVPISGSLQKTTESFGNITEGDYTSWYLVIIAVIGLIIIFMMKK